MTSSQIPMLRIIHQTTLLLGITLANRNKFCNGFLGHSGALFSKRNLNFSQLLIKCKKNNEDSFCKHELVPTPEENTLDRRDILGKTFKTCFVGVSSFASAATSASATSKSRTEGYPIQRSEREWAYILSGQQYNILRNGGTERPNSSILESEERPGLYSCAGCNTPLFDSAQKFHSGTGWPSFADTIKGNVEIEDVNMIQLNLGGAELRCATCGGHLGDVFNDGFLFVNTPAFNTGKRFCIDGAALIFKPNESDEIVYGDTPPYKKPNELPSFLEPPKINARSID